MCKAAANVQRAGARFRLDASVRARKAGHRRPPTREREQVPAPEHWATRRKGCAVPMHGLPACNSLLSLCSPVTQHVPVDVSNPLRAVPSYPRRPACTTPRGVPGVCRPPPPPLYPRPIHTPPAAQRGPLPASVPRLLPAGAAVWASPAPPPPPSPLRAVPPPDHRDMELAYLRGHVAGLDRRTEGPPPPKETAQGAPPAPQGPAPDAVGEAAPALLLAPVRETVLREDRRPPEPTEAPRRPQGTTYRRSRSPRRDLRDDRRGHGRTGPGRDGRTANRRPYRSPERYYQRRSEERSSGHRAPAARGRDHTPDRRDNRSRRDPPGLAPGPGRERRGPDDRRRRRSPSPDTARRLRYDAPHTGRRPLWEPRTAPDAQPPHVPRDKPPRKRQRNNKESKQPVAQSPAGTPQRLPVHTLAGTQTTPGLLAPRAQQARLPQDGVPRTPQRHRTGVTQTTPGLRGPGYAPPERGNASPPAAPRCGPSDRPAHPAPPHRVVPPSPGGPFHVAGWGGGGGGGFSWRRKPRVPDFPRPHTGAGGVCGSQCCPGYGSAPARPPAGGRRLCKPQCRPGPDCAHAAGRAGRRAARHAVRRGCPPARGPPLPPGG